MNAPSLEAICRDFQRRVLNPVAVAPDYLANSAPGGAEAGFAVYHAAYRARAVEVLVADFPAVQAALGEAAFAGLCREYAQSHPSRHPSVRWFGSRFCEFLAQIPEVIERPDWVELARFEWTLTEAFDAADAHRLSHADLAVVPPESWPELRVQLHPSLRTLTCRHGAPAIWQAWNAADTPPTLEKRAEPVVWAVWRSADLRLLFRALDRAESVALTRFAGGGTLALVCEQLAEILPETEVAETVCGYLGHWLAAGWLTDLTLDADAG